MAITATLTQNQTVITATINTAGRGPVGPTGPESTGGGVVWSETAPANPAVGDGWGNSATGKLYFWDGTVWVGTTAATVAADIAAFLAAANDAAARTALDAVGSVTTGITGADAITNIISLSQAEYDAITPDQTTLYVIV